MLLPLSRKALTIPDPTVPAPPSAKTTLSPFDIAAAAVRRLRLIMVYGAHVSCCSRYLNQTAAGKPRPLQKDTPTELCIPLSFITSFQTLFLNA